MDIAPATTIAREALSQNLMLRTSCASTQIVRMPTTRHGSIAALCAHNAVPSVAQAVTHRPQMLQASAVPIGPVRIPILNSAVTRNTVASKVTLQQFLRLGRKLHSVELGS